jgi:hypothetical protein
MWRDQEWCGNFLGLLPHETRRLTPAEMAGLAEGEQERWNRMAKALAWVVSTIRPLVAAGVGDALDRAFSEHSSPPEPIPLQKFIDSVPGYRKVDE